MSLLIIACIALIARQYPVLLLRDHKTSLYNLLLRETFSREVDKVTHVGAIALALITPCRTYRVGIEMPSSLFDCRKKNKANQNWNKQADKQRSVYKPKTKYPIQLWRLVLVATFMFAHPHNGGLHFTLWLKILPVTEKFERGMAAWATTNHR